jgi:hypothetical protein
LGELEDLVDPLVLEDLVDLLVEEVVLAVDAVAVHGEQDRDAVPGPGGDLGGVPSGVQPQ